MYKRQGGTLGVTGDSSLTGNTTVGGTLGVTGASSLTTLTCSGNSTIGGSLDVSDGLNVTKYFDADADVFTATGTGCGLVVGGVGSGTNRGIEVTGRMTIRDVNGAQTFRVDESGNAKVVNDLLVKGTATLTNLIVSGIDDLASSNLLDIRQSATDSNGVPRETIAVLQTGEVTIADPLNGQSSLQVIGNTVASGLVQGANFIANSDIRLKKDINAIVNTSQIGAIRPVTFKWVDGDAKVHSGVIAQELESILPDAVIDAANGFKAVDYTHIWSLLLASHQKLLVSHGRLEERLSRMEKRLERMGSLRSLS